MRYLGEFSIITKYFCFVGGTESCHLALSGNRGQEEARYVGNIQKHIDILKTYNEISIDGYRTVHESRPVIIAERIRINMNDMLRIYAYRLNKVIALISDEYCRKLVEKTLKDTKLYIRLISAPHALTGNFNCICGLFAHMVLTLEEATATTLPCNIDLSILLTSIIMKEIGISLCFSGDGFQFRTTKKGKGIGTTNLSKQVLTEKASSITGFPDELKMKLTAIISNDFGNTHSPATQLISSLTTAVDKLHP